MNLAQVVNTKAVIRTERFVRIRGDCLNKDCMSVVRLQKQVIRILAKLNFMLAILKKTETVDFVESLYYINNNFVIFLNVILPKAMGMKLEVTIEQAKVGFIISIVYHTLLKLLIRLR